MILTAGAKRLVCFLLVGCSALACVAEQSERDRERTGRRPSSRGRPVAQPADPAAPYVLEADRNAYVARRSGGTAANPQYTFRVYALFANRGDRAVALRRCLSSDAHPVYWITLVSDPPPGTEPVAAYDVINSCSAGAKMIRVAGRTQRTDTITFVGPMRTDGFTGGPVGALEGTFATRSVVVRGRRHVHPSSGCGRRHFRSCSNGEARGR